MTAYKSRKSSRRSQSAPKSRFDDNITELALHVMEAHSDEISKLVDKRMRTSKSDYEIVTELEDDIVLFVINVFGLAWRVLRDNPETAGMEFAIPGFVNVDRQRLVREAMDRYGEGAIESPSMDVFFDMGGMTFRLEVPDMGDIKSSVEEYDRVNGTEFSDLVDEGWWYKAGRRSPSDAITVHRFDEVYDEIHHTARVNRNRRRPAKGTHATGKSKGARR